MRLREGACWQGDTVTRKAELKGGSMGEPDNWLGTYIFRSRVSGDQDSGTGYRVRVRVWVLNLCLHQNT
jgi:hypothetical protein